MVSNNFEFRIAKFELDEDRETGGKGELENRGNGEKLFRIPKCGLRIEELEGKTERGDFETRIADFEFDELANSTTKR